MGADTEKVGEVRLSERDFLERKIKSLSISDSGVVVRDFGNGRIGVNGAEEGSVEYSGGEHKQGHILAGFPRDGTVKLPSGYSWSMPDDGSNPDSVPADRLLMAETERVFQETPAGGDWSDMPELASSSNTDEENDGGGDSDSVVESPGEPSTIPMEGDEEDAFYNAGRDPAECQGGGAGEEGGPGGGALDGGIPGWRTAGQLN